MCITQNMVFVSLKVVKTIDQICHLLFFNIVVLESTNACLKKVFNFIVGNCIIP
jgi:hypothetical protein